MGKQNITRLLTQLKENQTKDIENAAAIYTVAQVAVDALHQSHISDAYHQSSALPGTQAISKTSLIEQYGSFNACRKAAKSLGINFKKTPSWSQLEAAFSYRESCNLLIQDFLRQCPSQHLHGVSINIELG